jgi:hypothetical protein
MAVIVPNPLPTWTPSQWLAALGVTEAIVTRENVTAALRFFDLRMPSLALTDRFRFIKAMDLHSADRVREVMLAPPQLIAAFRKSKEPRFKLYYTKVGTSVHTLGVNPSTREFVRFQVTRPIPALQSRCAAARDDWTDPAMEYVAGGGGLQFIVPDASTQSASSALKLVP